MKPQSTNPAESSQIGPVRLRGRRVELVERTVYAYAIFVFLAAAVPAGVFEQADEYGGFNPGRPAAPGTEWVQAIVIRRPELRSEVKGDVRVEFRAAGMTAGRVLCWRQPTPERPAPWGHDAKLAPDLKLDADGNGSFVFPADDFPNGPVTVRILVRNDQTKKQDVRELQLYNTGGVAWNQGLPKTHPAAAAGMKLVFSDDFDGPLSISSDGKGKRYMAHKPGGGDFSGFPFTGPEGGRNPFSRKGTYLRIHASRDPADPKDNGSTGLIAPVDSDGNGFFATAPFYMECRFLAQSVPGSWPAFWAIGKRKGSEGDPKAPVDELDVIEAYGGVGVGNPNGYGLYAATSHFWNQTSLGGQPLKPTSARVDMTRVGGGSPGRPRSTRTGCSSPGPTRSTPATASRCSGTRPATSRNPRGSRSSSTMRWAGTAAGRST